jgi:hypothetical protein
MQHYKKQIDKTSAVQAAAVFCFESSWYNEIDIKCKGILMLE